MKKLFFLFLFAGIGLGLQAQDPEKDIKKAARLLGTYNLDPSGSSDKLDEAVSLATSAIKDAGVKSDPASWQTYGEIFMTVLNNDVAAFVLNPEAPISDPLAPHKAYHGFSMALKLAEKSYQSKDALKALSNGIQNIYYMGSALYQVGEYEAAYKAFKATYDGYALLKSNDEPNNFDPAEHNKSLYYSGLCAQEAKMTKEATQVFMQMVDSGIAEAGVYEALIGIYKAEDKPEMAEQILMAAREKFPDDTALLYAEINHLLAKGELEGLVTKLEAAIELDPNNVSVYVTLGQIFDKMYQDSVAANPAGAEKHFNKAMSYYQQALTKDDKNFDAIYSIGALWYNKAAAYSVELNAIADDYSPAGTRKYEAKKAQMDETFAKALPFFQQAEQLDASDVNTLIALKEIYARQDKFDLVESYKKKLEALGY